MHFQKVADSAPLACTTVVLTANKNGSSVTTSTQVDCTAFSLISWVLSTAEIVCLVGADVGSNVGKIVGNTVGSSVGENIGLEVGSDVGLKVGSSVGLALSFCAFDPKVKIEVRPDFKAEPWVFLSLLIS